MEPTLFVLGGEFEVLEELLIVDGGVRERMPISTLTVGLEVPAIESVQSGLKNRSLLPRRRAGKSNSSAGQRSIRNAHPHASPGSCFRDGSPPPDFLGKRPDRESARGPSGGVAPLPG
jgi:hypothetical protein